MFRSFPLLLLVVIFYNLAVGLTPTDASNGPQGSVAVEESADGEPTDDGASATDTSTSGALVGKAPTDAAKSTAAVQGLMDSVVFSVPMPSGSKWSLTYGDIFVVIGLMLLFIELIRSTAHDGSAIANHALSLAVMVLCIIEFVVLKGFATSTFFFITLMALIDVVAGFVISIRAARRDLSLGGGAIAP